MKPTKPTTLSIAEFIATVERIGRNELFDQMFSMTPKVFAIGNGWRFRIVKAVWPDDDAEILSPWGDALRGYGAPSLELYASINHLEWAARLYFGLDILKAVRFSPEPWELLILDFDTRGHGHIVRDTTDYFWVRTPDTVAGPINARNPSPPCDPEHIAPAPAWAIALGYQEYPAG